ncbi:MAG: right-handed parallel beta-helix repeat-containing protein [Thermoguttaceae bacterium]|nr:right-handed parallel beta-helix repeat-containing protein [Thermoguttaceae bacterium]
MAPFRLLLPAALSALFLFPLFAQDTSPARIDYYLSPAGSDAAAGTADAPLATLTAARDRIRADKAAGQTGTWTVHIQPGTYSITEPILFTPEDSGTEGVPITYRGQPDAEGNLPVISGGIEIPGWRDEGNGVWSADIPFTETGDPIYFEQLFVGNRRAARAREPNEGFLKVVSGWDENPVNREKNIYPKTTRQSVTAEPGALDFFKDVPAEELRFAHAVIHHHWNTTIRIILGVDTEKSEILMKGKPQPYHNPWQSDSLLEILNVRSAFDQPGEWFYDGVNRKVLYRPLPGEELAGARFFVPRSGLARALRFEGNSQKAEGTDETKTDWVENITFENIRISYFDTPRRPETMQDAEIDPAVTGDLAKPGPAQFEPAQAAMYLDSAVSGLYARRIWFIGCTVSHIGEYAFRLHNVKQWRIEKCGISDLGGGGIILTGDGGPQEDSPGISNENIIQNNHLREGGRFHASAVGVLIGNNTHDSDVVHNEIEDFFYSGVSVGWTWGYKGGSAFRNRIEYNKIHKIGQGSLADMGGVYTLGALHGTRVCNNVIYDIKSNSYGGWGLYTDEGSEGVLMENNLVYNTTDGSFHQHYGRGNLIRNNILIDSTPYQVVASRVEDHRSFTFENNIVVWSEGRAFGHRFEEVHKRVRSNLWYCTTGEAMFGDNGDKTYEQMKASGFDEGGLCADPLFVDPENRDYHLQPDSPAFKIGFVPFDYTQAGCRESAAE